MAQITGKIIIACVIALIVGIAIGYGVGIYTAPPKVITKVEKVPVHPLADKEVLIGIIHADTWYLEGEQAAANIWLEEVNEYLKKLGLTLKFKLLFENAEGSEVKCLEKLESLAAKGVKFVLGFRYSSHAKACLEYANEHKILLISDASTAPALAIADDYLFRMPCDDRFQGKAIARMILDYGVKAVAVLQRGDTWGDGLYEAFEGRFKELGGIILERIRYDPAKTEFSAEISILNDVISNAIEKYGKSKVALLFLGFEEIAPIQATAADYPALMSIPWFGSDGHVISERLLTEQGENAVKVKHLCTYIGVTRSPIYMRFAEKYKSIVGYYPEAYDTYLYDSLWLLTRAIIEAGSTDPEIIKEILPRIAESYFGASGWCRFNEAGDRAAGNYDIWAILNSTTIEKYGLNRAGIGEEIDWAIVGVYNYQTDAVEWLIPIGSQEG